MEKAIIHISDLHVSALVTPEGDDNKDRSSNTWLVAQDDEKNHSYINVFCGFIKDNFKNKDFYLLVSGDIADSSEEDEYKSALQFLQMIMTKLNITKDKVIIVPGNHDINRYTCREAIRNGDGTKKAYEYFDEKYKLFSDFYKKIKNNDFIGNQQIVDYLGFDDEGFCIIGVNSNYKIDHNGGNGYVNVADFKKEMNTLYTRYPKAQDFVKVAVFHHNMTNNYEKDCSSYGAFDKDNWLDFKDVLIEYNFRLVLFGNQHTRSSGQIDEQLYYCDSGSLGKKDPSSSFKLYEVDRSEKRLSIKQHLFILQNANKKQERDFGVWSEQQKLEQLNEVDTFVLIDQKENEVFNEDKNASCLILNKDINEKEENKIQENITHGENNDWASEAFRKELLSIIKERGLFHQGHFHWGKSSRSHNWIDTITLFNNRKHTGFIQKEMVEHIKTNDIQYDCVIGLGVEGNILATPLMTDNKPYTYLPYTYRYEEANQYEKNICLDNSSGVIKKVLIITDVVNKGSMIKNLITSMEKSFFDGVDDITIVSLFYTGEGLNDRNIPRGLECIEKNVRFCPMVHLEVVRCPYKDSDIEKCTNYKEHLCEVYKFYNETSIT